jgi:hypothetical protein
MRCSLVVLIGVLVDVLGSRLAAATPPPPSEYELVVEDDREMIEGALRACSQAVAAEGRLAAVDIEWSYGGPTPGTPLRTRAIDTLFVPRVGIEPTTRGFSGRRRGH